MLLFEGYSKKDPFCIWQICWIVVSVFWNIGAEIIPETPLSFPVTLLVLSILCNTITATHISWKPYISQLQQLNYRTKIINPTVLFSFSLWNYLSKRTSEYSLSKKKKKASTLVTKGNRQDSLITSAYVKKMFCTLLYLRIRNWLAIFHTHQNSTWFLKRVLSFIWEYRYICYIWSRCSYFYCGITRCSKQKREHILKRGLYKNKATYAPITNSNL